MNNGGDKETKNFKKVLKEYKTKKTLVELEEVGSFGKYWVGRVKAVGDDFIEFSGIYPIEAIENLPSVRFRIRRGKKDIEKSINEWRKKVLAKVRVSQIPFSNIASVKIEEDSLLVVLFDETK